MTRRPPSKSPFPAAVKDLMDEHEISGRELMRRTRKRGWGSPGTISFLLRDGQAPTMQAIEAIARALEVPPEHFADYRLAVARRNLDPAVVGFKTAMRNLGE